MKNFFNRAGTGIPANNHEVAKNKEPLMNNTGSANFSPNKERGQDAGPVIRGEQQAVKDLGFCFQGYGGSIPLLPASHNNI